MCTHLSLSWFGLPSQLRLASQIRHYLQYSLILIQTAYPCTTISSRKQGTLLHVRVNEKAFVSAHQVLPWSSPLCKWSHCIYFPFPTHTTSWCLPSPVSELPSLSFFTCPDLSRHLPTCLTALFPSYCNDGTCVKLGTSLVTYSASSGARTSPRVMCVCLVRVSSNPHDAIIHRHQLALPSASVAHHLVIVIVIIPVLVCCLQDPARCASNPADVTPAPWCAQRATSSRHHYSYQPRVTHDVLDTSSVSPCSELHILLDI